MKKTVLGAGSKAMHLAYLGDAPSATNVNIGAGTITCNYDGAKKHADDHRGRRVHRQRLAADRAGHGRRRRLRRHRHDLREDVPAGALAVSAGKQRNIEGWVERRRTQKSRLVRLIVAGI